MLGAILKLVPALQWNAVDNTPAVNHEQLAISSCVNAVQTYFPCPPTTTVNSTCLCEQYLWQVSCYDNHASNPSKHPDMWVAKSQMDDSCRSAGSIGASAIRRKYRLEGRQIGIIISSIGGDIGGFLSSNSIDILQPPAATSASAPQSPSTRSRTQTTASSAQRTSSSTSDTASSSSNASQAAASATSSAIPTEDTSKGTSAGLIAGVVVGAIAFLALVGALIWFALRHRRNKQRNQPSLEAQVPSTGHSHDSQEPIGLTKSMDHAVLSNEKNTFAHKEPAYLSHGVEMSTNANVWELDGKEIVPVGEMDASNGHGVDAHRTHPDQSVSHSTRVANEELFLQDGHNRPGTAV